MVNNGQRVDEESLTQLTKSFKRFKTRPMSNLPFISKILENVVVQQLCSNLNKYNLHKKYH